jgi:hypothetical protein
MGESDPEFWGWLMSRLDITLEPKPAEVRRIEMITGGERRRGVGGGSAAWGHAAAIVHMASRGAAQEATGRARGRLRSGCC